MRVLKKFHSDTTCYEHFELYRDKQPTRDELLKTLRSIADKFSRVFIVLDGLDECKDRRNLLACICQMVLWKLPNFCLLVTSRNERDIEESLQGLCATQINVHDAGIDAE